MTEERINYDYVEYGRKEDGRVAIDMIGFVSTKNINERAGGMRSFGVPLENVQGTMQAMFPDDFSRDSLPGTNWFNVAIFNSENYKLAERFGKAIEGKERIRVRITGIAEVNEYNGNKSVSVVANDFHILWTDSSKGTSVGGGDDGYSYVSGQKLKDGEGLMAVQGFVANPALRSLPDGRNVLNFSMMLNKANSAINYTLGSDIKEDAVWINIAIFDRDNYAAATNAAKVIRKGAAIAGFGFAKLEEYEGKERVALTLNGFDMLRYAPLDEDSSGVTDTTDSFNATVEEFDESPFEESSEFQFKDDDLPF